MAYDEKNKVIFPTREAPATGTSNERTMLDELGGADGIRHRQRTGVDGVVTHVKTRAGNPHFWSDEEPGEPPTTVLPVEMDSGAIDVVAVGAGSPSRLLDGVLHYGAIQRIYFALSKLLGKIKTSTLLTTSPPVELSAPASYKATLNSLGVRDPDMVARLYLKKLAISYAPASLFTGKTRLYAQALYGAPLKRWKWELVIGSGSSSYLTYGGNSALRIDTNTGVFLDVNTMTHWMIRMDNTGVRITKLLRETSVEPLVSKLATGDADASKIEAYILAYSYPSTTITFHIGIDDLPPAEMMGYGWKFNWSGNKCDIINTVVEEAVYAHPYYVSTHYRIIFSRSNDNTVMPGLSSVEREKARWSATLSIVEGPVHWKCNYTGEVIAFPNWSAYTLSKFGQKGGDEYGDAPFYCFYKKSGELEVIRCHVQGNELQIMVERTSSAPGWHIKNGWSNDTATHGAEIWRYSSIGMQDTSGEERMRAHNPRVAGFYSSSANGVTTTQAYDFINISVSGKSLVNKTFLFTVGVLTGDYLPGNAIATDSYYFTLDDGVVVTAGAAVTPSPGPFLPVGSSLTKWSSNYTATGTTIQGTHTEGVDSLVVVPFGDAEAAYLYALKTTSRIGTATSYTGLLQGCQQYYEYRIYEGDTSTLYEYKHDVSISPSMPNGSGYPDPTASPYNTVERDVVTSALVTGVGSLSFTPTASMSQFFDGSTPEVEQSFMTRSSTLGAIFGNGATKDDGYTGFSEPPPFIGWA